MERIAAPFIKFQIELTDWIPMLTTTWRHILAVAKQFRYAVEIISILFPANGKFDLLNRTQQCSPQPFFHSLETEILREKKWLWIRIGQEIYSVASGRRLVVNKDSLFQMASGCVAEGGVWGDIRHI